jgi:hypothetical protein
MTTPGFDDGVPDRDGSPAGTGHPRVDQMVENLNGAADLPPAEQIAALTDAHQVLREALDSIGDA